MNTVRNHIIQQLDVEDGNDEAQKMFDSIGNGFIYLGRSQIFLSALKNMMRQKSLTFTVPVGFAFGLEASTNVEGFDKVIVTLPVDIFF